MRRLAVMLLVDQRGWVLLQERDEHAPRGADQWGFPGGHVEDGEDFEAAAYRELEEETGVRLAPGRLALWTDEQYRYSDSDASHYRIYVAATDLTDDDIVVGEGRQIVFVSPTDIRALDLLESARHFVTRFLASTTYRQLTQTAAERG